MVPSNFLLWGSLGDRRWRKSSPLIIIITNFPWKYVQLRPPKGPGRSGPRSHDKMPNAHSPMNFGLIRSNRQIGIFGLDTSLSGRVSVCKDPGVSLCQVHKMSISKPFFTRWQAKHLIAVYSQACATKAISCKRLRSTFKCENNETLSPDLFVWYIRYIPVLKRATIDPWKIPPKRTRDVPIFLWEKFGAKLYCIRHVLRRWVACWYRINPYKWLARLLSEQELNDSRTECDPHTAGCIESLIALSHHRDVAEYRGSKRHQIVKLPGNIWDAASYASVISGVVRPYLETVYKSCDDLSIVQFSPHHKAHRITVQSVELFVSLSGWKEWKRHLIFFCAEHDVEHETYSAWTWQDLGLKGRSRLQLSRHPEFCLACSPAVAWQCKYVNIAKCEPCQSRFEIPRGLETSRI